MTNDVALARDAESGVPTPNGQRDVIPQTANGDSIGDKHPVPSRRELAAAIGRQQHTNALAVARV